MPALESMPAFIQGMYYAELETLYRSANPNRIQSLVLLDAISASQ